MLPLYVRAAENFPEPYDSETEVGAGAMKPEEVVRTMKLPPGFRANVFAAEPDVQNPIAMAWDAKGRLWVAENYTYAEAGVKFELKLRDRIIILEDTDGDGRMDRRKVFADDLQMLTGIEVGLGGVWCICPPQLIFLADKDGDDKPDGPPQLHLDGLAQHIGELPVVSERSQSQTRARLAMNNRSAVALLRDPRVNETVPHQRKQ